MLRLHYILPLLVFLLKIDNHKVYSQNVANKISEGYTKCAKGTVFDGQTLASFTSRSAVDCHVRCSQTAGCESVNVCPVDGRVDCNLLQEFSPSGCDGLLDASSPSCYYAQKNCHNGARQEGSTCHCTIQYAGQYCQRYIRDCSEANPWGSAFDGAYIVQPVSAPAPFWVYCTFNQWGGGTIVFRRRHLSFQNLNWTSAKYGYGEDLASQPQSQDFFVGLENIRYLTSQAEYTAHFSFYYFATSEPYGYKYIPFHIGPESTSYNISFKSHYPRFPDSPDSRSLFNGAKSPLAFSTRNRDTNDCANSRGAPGWYGSDCTGYSVFRDGLQLPKDGGDSQMDVGKLSLDRGDDEFYVDQ